jgi:hypothetical protein
MRGGELALFFGLVSQVLALDGLTNKTVEVTNWADLRDACEGSARYNGPICSDGSTADCCDSDGNCFDGDDDWCCYGDDDVPALKNLGIDGCEDDEEGTCSECEGNCEQNDDCTGDLKCFKRSGNQPVPGCRIGGGKEIDKQGYGFCFNSTKMTSNPGGVSIGGKSCLQSNVLTVNNNCVAGPPHYDSEGSVCAYDGTAREAYCSYGVSASACARCNSQNELTSSEYYYCSNNGESYVTKMGGHACSFYGDRTHKGTEVVLSDSFDVNSFCESHTESKQRQIRFSGRTCVVKGKGQILKAGCPGASTGRFFHATGHGSVLKIYNLTFMNASYNAVSCRHAERFRIRRMILILNHDFVYSQSHQLTLAL